MKEEIEHCRAAIQQLHQEKKELAEDAKLARVYRDEIETLKVQSAKVEKLEADVVKYRQKAEDTEYLRKRIAVSLRTVLSLSLSLSLSSTSLYKCEGVVFTYKYTIPGSKTAE